MTLSAAKSANKVVFSSVCTMMMIDVTSVSKPTTIRIIAKTRKLKKASWAAKAKRLILCRCLSYS